MTKIINIQQWRKERVESFDAWLAFKKMAEEHPRFYYELFDYHDGNIRRLSKEARTYLVNKHFVFPDGSIPEAVSNVIYWIRYGEAPAKQMLN